MHTDYYAEGRKFEPIEVIVDWKLDFCLSSALKYISRIGRKGDTLQSIEDVIKAIDYLKYEEKLLLDKREKETGKNAKEN